MAGHGICDNRALRIAFLVLISTAITVCGVRDQGNMAPERADVLLFKGNGTSPNDVKAVEAILNSQRLHHVTVGSSKLNRMGESQIQQYRLLIVPGDSGHNGLNLTSGVRFGFYSAESRGIRKAAVAIASAGAPILDHYWEDGPEFTGWGAVVGRYPDGAPAIVQGTFGSGWVILTGVHPEAPAEWRRGMTFTTPASTDNAYAATLIHGALNRTSLPHY